MGKVYLIGAGPGDEQLLTLKAVSALGKCTAVMYDRLAGKGVLRHLNEKCEIYYCGKEPGCHYKTQDEINDMLVELVKKGHVVGRVKGGDPFVFGRGGEEILRLNEEGFDFEVIPGITSAISVLSYAGIPATHRKIAQSFHVFTGMSVDKLNIDWSAVAKLTGTLIFLMGLDNIEYITGKLISNGVKSDVPCAVVMRGTTSKQRKVVGTIQNIRDKVEQAGLKSPCIIVVGEVVNFHEEFSWFEKKPLFGINVCITRSKEQAGGIRETLLELGAEVTEINTIKIKNTSMNLDNYKDKLKDYNYIVLTSVNGVNVLFNRLKELKIDIRTIKAKLAAIGPATADALIERGIIPTIVSDEFVAEALFDKLKGEVKTRDSILLPRSKNARPFLYEALLGIGCNVDEVFTYEVVEGDILTDRPLDEVDIILFTSPSTVKNLIAMAGIESVSSKRCIAIGPITAAELTGNGIEFEMCDEYNIDGIVKKLLEITQ